MFESCCYIYIEPGHLLIHNNAFQRFETLKRSPEEGGGWCETRQLVVCSLIFAFYMRDSQKVRNFVILTENV